MTAGSPRAARAVYLGALALGVAIRLADFLRCRSLGLDEARLAVNVASRTPLGLLAPLSMDQSAPPVFLWGERAAFQFSGHGDCALRLLPVAAGAAAAALMYPLARRFLARTEALLAALIGIFSPLLITYSNAVKQYSFELLTAVLLLLLIEQARGDDTPRVRAGMLIAGVLAPWASLSSAFLLATAWVLLLAAAARGRPGTLRLALSTAVAWGVSGAIAYATVYRAASRNPYMHRFWELAFLTPSRPGFGGHAWKSLEDQVWAFIAGDPLVDRRPFALVLPLATLVVVCLCVVGLHRVLRTRGVAAGWLLCGPVVLTFIASMLGLFPIAPRLTLFLLPELIVLFVAGLAGVLAGTGAPVSPRRLVLEGLVVVLPLEFQSVVRASAREPSADFRTLVREVRERRLPGEPVYVFARSLPAWIFYSTDWEHPDTLRLRVLTEAAASTGRAFENAPSRGRVSEEEAAASSVTARGELLGIPSGMEWREVQEHVRAEPDSGWVQVERRRIEAAASPGIWVLASTYYAPEMELFREVERHAARRTFADMRNGSILVRYEFDSGATLGRRRTVTRAGK